MRLLSPARTSGSASFCPSRFRRRGGGSPCALAAVVRAPRAGSRGHDPRPRGAPIAPHGCGRSVPPHRAPRSAARPGEDGKTQRLPSPELHATRLAVARHRHLGILIGFHGLSLPLRSRRRRCTRRLVDTSNGPPCGLAALLCLEQQTALFRNRCENCVLVDSAAAFPAEPLGGLSMLPESDGLATEVGIGHPDVVAGKQFDKHGAEIPRIIFDPQLTGAVVHQMSQPTILISDTEQANTVAPDDAFLKR